VQTFAWKFAYAQAQKWGIFELERKQILQGITMTPFKP